MLIGRIDPEGQRPDGQSGRVGPSIRPDAQGVEVGELHVPRTRCDADASEDGGGAGLRLDDGEGVELEVARGEGADAVAGAHGLGVEAVDLPVAVGEVAAAAGVVDVGGAGLGEQRGHEVVQLVAREPVAAQAVRVDALEFRDPPRGAAGDLFGVGAVFVDVDRAEGEVVGLQDRDEAAVRGDQVAATAFHVPGILVRDRFVLGDEGGVVRPPGVVG